MNESNLLDEQNIKLGGKVNTIDVTCLGEDKYNLIVLTISSLFKGKLSIYQAEEQKNTTKNEFLPKLEN